MKLDDQQRIYPILRWSLLSLALVVIVGLFIPITISTNQTEQSAKIDISLFSSEETSTVSDVSITNNSNFEIQLAPPVTKFPEIFGIEKTSSIPGYFEGCNCIGLSPGKTITITGLFGNLKVQVLSDNSGELLFKRDQNGLSSGFTVLSQAQTVEIPSLVNSLWRTTNLFEVLSGKIPAVQGEVEIFTPNHSEQLSNPVESRITQVVAGLAIIEIGNSSLLWLSLFISIFFLWALGKLSLWAIPNSQTQSAAVFSWIGLLIVALPLSLLSYFTSVSNAAMWIVIVLLIFVICFVFKNFKSISKQKILNIGTFSSKGNALKAIAVTAISFPVTVFFGSGFFGEFKTDFYDYANQSALMRSFSLPEIWLMKASESPQAIDPLFGWNLRSIDTALASAISLVTQNSNQALTFLALLLFALGVLSIINIFEKISNGKQPNLLLLLLLVSAPLTGLFVESYFSQFVFVIGLFALIDAYLAYQSKSSDYVAFIYFALINAFLICVYPYFWFVGIISLVISASVTNGWRWFITKQQLLLVGAVTLLVSTSWIPAINFRETNIYNDALNQIANVWLLSPFDKTQSLSLALGGLSYEWRQGTNASPEGIGFFGKFIWGAGQTLYQAPWIGILIVGLAFGILGITFLAKRKFISKSSGPLPIIILFFAFCIAGIYFGVQGGTYASLKFFWTSAALLPILIIAITALIPNKITTLLIPAILFPLFFTVNIVNNGYWFSNLNADSSSNAHVNAIRDVNQFRLFLKNQNPNSVIFIEGDQTLQGSDRDRVLLNQLIAAAEDSGTEFQNCVGNKLSQCQFDSSSTIITIGKTEDLNGYTANQENSELLRISFFVPKS